MRADLHIHTYFSDGLQSPEDVALCAKSNGVGLIPSPTTTLFLPIPNFLLTVKKRE